MIEVMVLPELMEVLGGDCIAGGDRGDGIAGGEGGVKR